MNELTNLNWFHREKNMAIYILNKMFLIIIKGKLRIRIWGYLKSMQQIKLQFYVDYIKYFHF